MPDLTSMSAAVGALLKERQQTVAVTESSCGGLISASLVAVPGCSAFFVGGATIYTRTAQYGLLHVAESAFEGIRSSSEPYALMNSRNVREALGTTWALSETGASGPRANMEERRPVRGTNPTVLAHRGSERRALIIGPAWSCRCRARLPASPSVPGLLGRRPK